MERAESIHPDSPLPTMTVHEFWKIGLLQEVNRRFLHPLGLALSVIVEEGGREGTAKEFGVIWDYRDDPEGLRFDEETRVDPDTVEKAARVEAMWQEATRRRMQRLGYVVQPVPPVGAEV